MCFGWSGQKWTAETRRRIHLGLSCVFKVSSCPRQIHLYQKVEGPQNSVILKTLNMQYTFVVIHADSLFDRRRAVT